MWHRSCTREDSQDKASSVKPVSVGGNHNVKTQCYLITDGTDHLEIGIPKDAKKPTNPQHFVYELVD